MVMTIPDHSQTHRFPNLGVVIRVDWKHDGVPCIDVQAPQGLLENGFDAERFPSAAEPQLTEKERSRRRHHICNQMHIASMSLDLLQQTVDACERDDVEQTLEIALDSIGELESLAARG
ncbi:hypothetical protein [Aporhodopirellula aestuarii]|uniref:Uncharacterized protein n=1 Tax=Aporhodopirellula aestuarii TaxID=2950107 RepID=A0ABT0TYV9_9BACT|nr:hypothetical protein [Aporhodopirellula aestuarii]MCM2369671.1 hypothetical protein [Aporhodopirellula aestuarii]